MLTRVRFAIVFLALVLPTSALALTTAKLNGSWIVTWGNKTQNAMSLTSSGDRLSGT